MSLVTIIFQPEENFKNQTRASQEKKVMNRNGGQLASLGLARYLQAAVAHPEAHGVHVNVVGLSCLRSLLVLRKSLYKWSWGVLVLKDCSDKTKEKEERAGCE